MDELKLFCEISEEMQKAIGQSWREKGQKREASIEHSCDR